MITDRRKFTTKWFLYGYRGTGCIVSIFIVVINSKSFPWTIRLVQENSPISTYVTSIWRPRWRLYTPLEFRRNLWHQYGVVCVILDLVVLVELRLVTDGQTDGQADRQKNRQTDNGDSLHGARIASRSKKQVSEDGVAYSATASMGVNRGEQWYESPRIRSG